MVAAAVSKADSSLGTWLGEEADDIIILGVGILRVISVRRSGWVHFGRRRWRWGSPQPSTNLGIWRHDGNRVLAQP
jgi:hypothetical protein